MTTSINCKPLFKLKGNKFIKNRKLRRETAERKYKSRIRKKTRNNYQTFFTYISFLADTQTDKLFIV